MFENKRNKEMKDLYKSGVRQLPQPLGGRGRYRSQATKH